MVERGRCAPQRGLSCSGSAVVNCLVGCATQPAMSWFRADGKPVVPIQFEADETNCRDEVQKARLAGSNQLGLLSRLQAHDDVFASCMADKRR
jgi:hypothetical protein